MHLEREHSGAARTGARLYTAVACLGVVASFLWLAFDGRLHWDEVAYLYTGGFLDRATILRGEFLGGIYLSRLAHIALIGAIVGVVGPGPTALAILIGGYFAALLLVARLAFLILRALLADARGLGLAVIGGMFTPIYLYLAFKTMPEIPALLMVSVATWALLAAFAGRPLPWLAVVSLALAATAFLKYEMILLYGSLAASLLLLGAERYPRRRLLVYGLASGLGALALIAAVLWLLGIQIADYVRVGTRLLNRQEPLAAKLLNIALEGGVYFLAVPLALLSDRRREVWLCLTWFLLATLPLPLLIAHFESRYLAANLVPLIGLLYLAADGLAPRALAWWRRRRALAAGAAGLTILIVLGNALVALPIMTHEVRIDRMQRLIARLDRLYPDRNYAILTPYTYSDFSYLRFVYPDRPVHTVQSEFNRSSSNWEYYSDRVIRGIAGLKALEVDTLIYLGFHENPAVENLRRLVDWIPLPILRAAFEQKRFQDHLTLSWMWTDPGLVFGEPLAEGHYRAYPVRIR